MLTNFFINLLALAGSLLVFYHELGHVSRDEGFYVQHVDEDLCISSFNLVDSGLELSKLAVRNGNGFGYKLDGQFA